MAEKTINARIRCKIDTAENWKTNNPVLLVGELGIESDTKLIKVGDGTTSWTSLPYLQYLPLSGGQLTGALKIARGFQNGLLDTDDGDILYIDNDGNLCIGYGLSGKTKLTSNRIDVESNAFYVKHNFYVENGSANFQYNGKSVAVKDDIPKTLNNKTLVANGNTTIYGTDITLSSDNSGNLTDAINGKADTSAIPTKTSQLTNDSGFATTSQIPDISGKANLSGGNKFCGLQGFKDGINFAAPSGLVGGKIYSDGDLNVDFHDYLYFKNYTYGDNSQWYIHIDSNGNLIFGKG